MGRLLDAIAVGGGLVGLGVVAALFVDPSLILDRVPSLARTVATLDPSVVLLVVAVLLLVVAFLKVVVGRFRRGSAPDATADLTPSRSASLYGATEDLDALGTDADDAFDVATTYGTGDEERRRAARERLVDDLRATAATAYAQSRGGARAEGDAAVAAGEWTDDRRAAGLLAGDDGPSIPVHLWLLDLLLGRDPFVEAVDHALAAVADLNGDDLTGDVGPAGTALGVDG